MIEVIHWIFATPPRFEASALAKWRLLYPLLYHAEYAIFFAASMARLLLITFVVVPLLALTFIALGIFFHIPRMGAVFACWLLMHFCLSHVERSQPPLPLGNDRKRGLAAVCQGKCCTVCSICTSLFPLALAQRGTSLCCSCSAPIVVLPGSCLGR